MQITRRALLGALLAAAAAPLAAQTAAPGPGAAPVQNAATGRHAAQADGVAQAADAALPAGWPAKPISIFTPFAAGSGPDAVLRQVAERLGKGLGQRVLVENRPGASGFLAVEAVQRAAPDGHTFLQLDSEHLAAVPALYPQRRFRPFESLAPVATFFRTPFMVVVPTTSPWKTMGDLTAAAKASPAKLNYGSWGVGSPGHLGGEHLALLADVKMQHVPFREAAQLFAAVGNGDVDWSFGSIASSQAAHKFGKVRYLAVAAPKRVPAMPDVPTVAEAGGPAALDVNSFVVLMAPRGVPAAIVDRMNAEMARAVADPQLKARLDTFAFEPIAWSPEEIVSQAEAKARLYGDLIKRANIQLD